jgi:hypothetical protein
MMRPRTLVTGLITAIAAIGFAAPTASASASALVWSKPIKIADRALTAVSCPTTSLCAMASAGYVFTTRTPAHTRARQTSHEADPPIGIVAPQPMRSISCAGQALCAAISSGNLNDSVIASKDPFAPGAGSWHRSLVPTTPPSQVSGGDSDALLAISCPSASLCVAGGADENVDVSVDPTGGESSWSVDQIDNAYIPCDAGPQSPAQTCPAEIGAISCPSVHLCVAGDTTGQVLMSTDPAAGAETWTATRLAHWTDQNEVPPELSCPTRSFCALVGNPTGQVFTSTDPTGGVSAWHATSIGDTSVQAISCASTSLCVAVDSKGNAITSTDPTAAHPPWVRTKVDPSRSITKPGQVPVAVGLTGVACPSIRLCIAVDANGNDLIATPGVR